MLNETRLSQTIRTLGMLSLATFAVVQIACSRSEFDAPMAKSPSKDAGFDENVISEQHSRMIVAYEQVADGSTAAEVTLELRNSKAEPRAGLIMELEVSGSGNVVRSCTMSDAAGISRCRFFSTTAEIKTVKAIGLITLAATTRFEAPVASSNAFAVVTSSGSDEIVGGPLLVASSGLIASDAALRDASGTVIIFSSILGSVLAQ